MKALVGIDHDGAYAPGLHLLKRLGFTDAHVTLLHACNPALVYAPFGAPAGVGQAEFFEATQKAGEATLKVASETAAQLGLDVQATICLDGATDALSHKAVEDHDDLIVVGAHKRSPAQAMFLGSVSRALAMGSPCSVLVAKGNVDHERPLKAVFATDHSRYAERCLTRFLEMKPTGIESVDVLTAYEIDDYEAALLHVELPKLGGLVDEWLEETLCDKGHKVAAKLQAAGYATSVHVQEGKANQVIAEEMHAKGADLLIIGAQGHGFHDRHNMGNVSVRQVVSEAYSVLLLRA